jgi:hypothetical protein
VFDYETPTNGTVVFRSLRHAPDGEQVLSIAHLEGKPLLDIDPTLLSIPGLEGGGWKVALRSPTIGPDYEGGPISLHDSMALIYTRNRSS